MFELIYFDLWTSLITSLSGFKYYILFLDDFTHFLWVFPLCATSDVFDVFVIFHAYVQTQFQSNTKLFQYDNDREFKYHSVLSFCASKRIKIHFSCLYTSQQNGKVERAIWTINNVIHTFLFQSYLPPTFWVEALLTTVHTINLLPTTILSFKTPFELLFCTFPSYNHLRVFGCLCHIATHKLSPRSSACVISWSFP